MLVDSDGRSLHETVVIWRRRRPRSATVAKRKVVFEAILFFIAVALFFFCKFLGCAIREG